jgi:hypothetical protein
MYIKVNKENPAEYVPDILFKDGTYKNKKDYIKQMKDLENKLMKEGIKLAKKKLDFNSK